ncbi:hypothetical protein TSUD_171540 [Trifolium subterraneum]|uniref:Uncharacterized protein n=1 Tax=Trifolium subterraneum TaxID=3900 RepID=A0A2Z6MNR4_TRISU|nr:hypothetical protein TSUD_171540 [Trifolium subterraneum]
MLHLQPPCTTELPSNAHVFGFASMLSVLFNSGSCYFWNLFAIFSVIKFALHKGNVDKKEALENLNLILIVLCINELILKVDSSWCNLLYWLDGCYLPLHKFNSLSLVRFYGESCASS